MEGYGGAKLCAGEGVHNYLEINNRRSDNECVKSQSQTNSSVAELDASITLFALSGVSTRHRGLWKFWVAVRIFCTSINVRHCCMRK